LPEKIGLDVLLGLKNVKKTEKALKIKFCGRPVIDYT
jgi:hypothetical protein